MTIKKKLLYSFQRVKIKKRRLSDIIMSIAFQKSIERKSLYLSESAQGKAGKEINSAMDEMVEARLSYAGREYKSATVKACQSLFHMARALLYSKGYEGESLSCVIGGIDHLFAEQGLIEIKWIMILLRALSFKEGGDYLVEYSREEARFFIESAVQFLKVAEDLLALGEIV